MSVLLRVGTSRTPGRSGTAARAPTLMKMRSAASRGLADRDLFGPVKRAWPWTSVTPRHAGSQSASSCRPVGTMRVDAGVHRLHVDRDRAGDRRRTRRRGAPSCATLALAISVLVGRQPVLMQVPPRCRRSTSATLRPAPASRTASDGPAWPAPMTMSSKTRSCRSCEADRDQAERDRRGILEEGRAGDRSRRMRRAAREARRRRGCRPPRRPRRRRARAASRRRAPRARRRRSRR